MAFFAYYFDWDSILGVLFGVLGVLFGILGVLFGVLCILFGVLGVFFAVLGVFILWINFPKNSPFRVLCGKGTPAWKRYTTAGCGGCDNYEVCIQVPTCSPVHSWGIISFDQELEQFWTEVLINWVLLMIWYNLTPDLISFEEKFVVVLIHISIRTIITIIYNPLLTRLVESQLGCALAQTNVAALRLILKGKF